MEIAAFVITLRRSTERAGQVAKLIAQSPVPCSVWDAVDGSALSPAERTAAYRPRLHAPAYPFALKPGELGCFLSHRGLWKEMQRRRIAQALILEDDVELLPNFAETLRFASSSAGPSDYIQFQVRDVQPRGRIVATQNQLQILHPTRIPLRTSAQLVTLGAAETLLRHTESFDRPIDSFLQMSWLHGVRVLMTRPRCVAEISARLGGSTIGAARAGRSPLSVIARQWKRSLYRLRIAAQATRAATANITHTPASRTQPGATL